MSRQPQTQSAYVLKISLQGVKPAIWRRFCVPGAITLDRLHDVIQVVIGWNDYHCHSFEIAGARYTESPEDPEVHGQEESRFMLTSFLPREGEEFGYEYDYGDNWRHKLTIEKISEIPV